VREPGASGPRGRGLGGRGWADGCRLGGGSRGGEREGARADREPVALARSLAQVAGALGLPSPAVLGRLQARWGEVVGEELRGHVELVAVEGPRLRVVADSPAAAAAARLRRAVVLARAAETAGVTALSELDVRVVRG
jgi:hypothetical protein